jgi:membrane associated rhomboid family serine protease
MTVPAPSCYRHPDRPTYVSCVRCGRHACGECMRPAAVGQQCVDCVHESQRGAPRVHTRSSARITHSGVVTYLLIAVNVVMFVLQSMSTQLQRDLVLWPPGVAEGQWYRLVTSAFLHYGIAHIAFNMWALWAVGPQLEQWLGRLRFGVLYGLSGLGGSVLVYLLSPLNSASAGASGAIFGLFGATFVLLRRLRVDARGIMAVIVINLVITFVVPLIGGQAISWQAHVGGLVTGAAVAAVFAYVPALQRKLALVSVTAILLVVFVGLIVWRTQELQAMYGLSAL